MKTKAQNDDLSVDEKPANKKNILGLLIVVLGLGVGGYNLPLPAFSAPSDEGRIQEIRQQAERDLEIKQQMSEFRILLEKINKDIEEMRSDIRKLDQRQWDSRASRR